jgi:hypothetical protein
MSTLRIQTQNKYIGEAMAKPKSSSTSPPQEKRQKMEEQNPWIKKLEFCVKKVTLI